MHFTQALAVTAFAVTAHAHSTMFSVWVNDVDQGDGRSVYIRSPPNNNPVKDLASSDLVCNVNGATAVSKFVPVTAGDKLTFEWYHDTRADDIIASSHLGPIITYIAPYTATNGAAAIWTKIAEEGYDGASWAVDKLIANKGKKDFTLPASLAAGKYLIRQEIIALHEADTTFDTNSARGAQFYPSCVQVDVSSSGSDVPNQDFDFNTGYTYADAGIHFNLYSTYTSYTIPGPKVWSGAGSSPAVSSSASTQVSTTAGPSSSALVATTSTSAADIVPTTTALVTSSAPEETATELPIEATSSATASIQTTVPTSTFATVRRPTKSQTLSTITTTAKPASTHSDVAGCSPQTRTVTVQGRPGRPRF
jgi:cellulase